MGVSSPSLSYLLGLIIYLSTLTSHKRLVVGLFLGVPDLLECSPIVEVGFFINYYSLDFMGLDGKSMYG